MTDKRTCNQCYCYGLSRAWCQKLRLSFDSIEWAADAALQIRNSTWLKQGPIKNITAKEQLLLIFSAPSRVTRMNLFLLSCFGILVDSENFTLSITRKLTDAPPYVCLCQYMYIRQIAAVSGLNPDCFLFTDVNQFVWAGYHFNDKPGYRKYQKFGIKKHPRYRMLISSPKQIEPVGCT